MTNIAEKVVNTTLAKLDAYQMLHMQQHVFIPNKDSFKLFLYSIPPSGPIISSISDIMADRSTADVGLIHVSHCQAKVLETGERSDMKFICQ